MSDFCEVCGAPADVVLLPSFLDPQREAYCQDHAPPDRRDPELELAADRAEDGNW